MARRVRARFRYLRKWLILGVAINVIAGLGAVVFYLALTYTTEFLLGYLGGYQVPTANGDGGNPGSSGFSRPWAIPLVTTLGALTSAVIVARFAPEAEGHGTDSAIEAVHTDPRAIRGRVVLVKIISSALTIGSGGSAGREGPTAQNIGRVRVAVDPPVGPVRRGRPGGGVAGHRIRHRGAAERIRRHATEI
jgi:chloride channel protein, CIC family